MNVELLRAALKEKMGQTITPQVAAWIEAFATFEPDNALHKRRFEPLHDGRYVFGVESFEQCLEELKVLHRIHWLETERHRHGINLEPDYEELFKRERAGRLLQVNVRDQENGSPIVGQLRMYLGKSTHTSTLVAEEDTLFVHPEHRHGMLGMKLIRYTEQCLRQIGVREIRSNSKLVNKADVLMRRMKYTPVATQFVKIFEEKSDVQ